MLLLEVCGDNFAVGSVVMSIYTAVLAVWLCC